MYNEHVSFQWQAKLADYNEHTRNFDSFGPSNFYNVCFLSRLDRNDKVGKPAGNDKMKNKLEKIK